MGLDPHKFVISYAARRYADVDWSVKADRWRASFYTEADTTIFGTAEITRVIPGVTPNPREALEADPGLLDRIPRVIFTEAGELTPAIAEMKPVMMLLLESVRSRTNGVAGGPG